MLDRMRLIESDLRSLVAALRQDLSVSAALATCLDAEHCYFIVQECGRPGETFSDVMPREHTICQHTVAMDFPLIVDDAFAHPLLRGNSFIAGSGIAAYLGAPVHDAGARAAGTICVLQERAFHWSNSDIDVIVEAAGRIEACLADATA